MSSAAWCEVQSQETEEDERLEQQATSSKHAASNDIGLKNTKNDTKGKQAFSLQTAFTDSIQS